MYAIKQSQEEASIDYVFTTNHDFTEEITVSAANEISEESTILIDSNESDSVCVISNNYFLLNKHCVNYEMKIGNY